MTTARISSFSQLLRRPWYWLWKAIAKAFYDGRTYTLQIPFGHRVYTPWFNPSSGDLFSTILKKARASGPLVVSPDRYHLLFQFAQRCRRTPGDIAECGVYTGGTAFLLAEASASISPSRVLHLFDTFSGMPDNAVPSRDYHAPGEFSDTSLQGVKDRLSPYLSSCKFHPGFMPDTFSQVADVGSFSLVHVDVDIYPAARACCEFFWPRLSVGGVMLFDDYGFYPYRFAIHAAVNEFFGGLHEPVISLPTGQAFVIKSQPIAPYTP